MINFLNENRTGKSKKWKHWISALSYTTYEFCESEHGRIFDADVKVSDYIPVHPYCKCRIEAMRTIKAGNATFNGLNGADVHLCYCKNYQSIMLAKE